MKNVLVVGCGPAGLFAAWAAINRGCRVTIIGDPIGKPNTASAGVFLLHDDMDLPLRSRLVDVVPSGGNADDYRRKVYCLPGPDEVEVPLPVSFPSYRHSEQYWDGRQGIDFAWDIVARAATLECRRIGDWTELVDWASRWDETICTVPLPALFPHTNTSGFVGQPAWVYTSIAPADEAYMMYNANPSVPWYRASAAWGVFNLEYATKPTDGKKYTPVRKVISRPADLDLPPNILFTGRFGAWDKSKLSHSAYDDTMGWLAR